MTPTEAARIVDKPIAAMKWPRRWLLAVAVGVVLVIAGNPTAHTRQRLPPWGEPEVGGYAAAITTVGIMTTPTIMIEWRSETRRLWPFGFLKPIG